MRRVEESRSLTRDFWSTDGFSKLRPADVSRPTQEQLGELRSGLGLEGSPLLVVDRDVHAAVYASDLLNDGEVAQSVFT